MKSKFTLFQTISVLLLIIAVCEKENTFEFGDLQTGFSTDSTYQAVTDGLLTVFWHSANFQNNTNEVFIFSDNHPNPTTIVGRITWPSTATVPIKKDNYWKVSHQRIV